MTKDYKSYQELERVKNMSAYKCAEQHILDAIDGDGYEGVVCETEEQKAMHSFNRFKSEYGWAIDRYGMHKALSEWLSGLALNIAFYNYDILRLAREWGRLPAKATESQEDKILDSYWQYMAMRLLDIWRRNGLL